MLGRLLSLLGKRQKLGLALLGVGMIGMGVMELLGVASIFPFIQLVASDGPPDPASWLGRVYAWAGSPPTAQFQFAAGLVVLAVIGLTNLVGAATTWYLYRFAWAQNHRLTTHLLRRYLTQPYAFFLGRNTAELSQKVLTEVYTVVSGILLPGLHVCARTVSVLLLLTLMAVVDPGLAGVVALVFGGSYALVYLLMRRKQYRLGTERYESNTARFGISREVLVGIKDVKALGREDEFLRRFAGPSWRYSIGTATNQIMGRLPRFALETIAFGTIIVIILVRLRGDEPFAELLPVLSLYVFAGYRIMPALNQLFNAVVTIRFNLPALEELQTDLFSIEGDLSGPAVVARKSVEPMGLSDAVVMRGVAFRFEDERGFALQDLDVRIGANEMVGFVGTTGSGKTTIVDLVLGLLRPTAGSIEVDGVALDATNVEAWRKSCGYVPQDVFLSDDSIAANIAFGLPPNEVDDDAVRRAATVAQLDEFVKSLPDGYTTVVGERGVRLSGGQRQRIGIARALYHDPDVLIMDEATSALDGATEAALLDTIGALARRKTLVMIAHRLTTVRACDRIYLLDRGRILDEGTFEELHERNEGFRVMAGDT